MQVNKLYDRDKKEIGKENTEEIGEKITKSSSKIL